MTETFGARLKKARTDAEFTQEEFGNLIGCSRDTIRRYETGKSFPSTHHLFQSICRRLSVSADQLLGLDGGAFSDMENGVQWQDIVTPEKSDHIEKGKTIFKALVRDRLRPDDIRLSYRDLEDDNINQMKQMLRTVLYSGSIRLVNVQRDNELEQALTDAYGLKRCFVANIELPQDMLSNIIITEAIALLAAKEADTYLHGTQLVALLGGGVLSRWSEFVQFHSADISAITWVAMLSEAGVSSPVGGTANTIVNKIAHYQPNANFHLLSYVNPERRCNDYYATARGADLAELRKARETLMKARSASVAMFSVGAMTNWTHTPDVPPLRDHLTTLEQPELERCVGDILRRFVDVHGDFVGSERFVRGNADHVYSLSFDDLRQIASNGYSVLVAGRVNKFAVIYAALRQQIANTLIIDRLLAMKLLDMKRIEERHNLSDDETKPRLEKIVKAMEEQEKFWRQQHRTEGEIAQLRRKWIEQTTSI